VTSELVIVDVRRRSAGSENDVEFLKSRRLYKALSLLTAMRAGIPAPPSLLLLAAKEDAINDVIAKWGLPVMVRVDFSSRPHAKALGGIPLQSHASVMKVCRSILADGCYPLLHPHISRFDDVYSAGIGVLEDNSEVHIEVVGPGFDASDLRLGEGVPHERLTVAPLTLRVLGRDSITAENYSRARERRLAKISRLLEYEAYVQRRGSLLPSLESLPVHQAKGDHDLPSVPAGYAPLPPELLSSLLGITARVCTELVPELPVTKQLVASLSYVADRGWVFWDAYGSWYDR